MVVVPAIYCYAWKKTFAEIPTIDELKNEYVIPLGWFVEQTFPNRDKLTYIGNDRFADALKDMDPSKLSEKWKLATLALAKEANLIEDYPIELCEKLCDTIQRSIELTSSKVVSDEDKGEN